MLANYVRLPTKKVVSTAVLSIFNPFKCRNGVLYKIDLLLYKIKFGAYYLIYPLSTPTIHKKANNKQLKIFVQNVGFLFKNIFRIMLC